MTLNSNRITLKKFNTNEGACIAFDTIEKAKQGMSAEQLHHLPIRASENRIDQLRASSALCKGIYGDEIIIIRSETGKPSLSGSKNHISISHSLSHIALISSSKEVAIDIERSDRDVTLIASKFHTQKEHSIAESGLSQNPSLLIWTIKECLFKLTDKIGVDFKSHLCLLKVEQADDLIVSSCRILHPLYDGDFLVKSFIFDNHLISYIDDADNE